MSKENIKGIHNKKQKIFVFDRLAGKPDFVLLSVVVALVLVGLVFVYSASFYSAEINISNKFYYFNKQLVGAVAGLIALIICIFLNTRVYSKISLALLICSIVLLALVFVPFLGIERYGARRWIGFGSFSFQPSEIAKFSLVCFSAAYLSNERVDTQKLTHILPVYAVGGIFCVLIILEPNMSVTMCTGVLTIALLFIGGSKIKNVVVCLLPLVAAVPVLIIAEPYRLERLSAFLNPWASPKDEGYQLIQSLYALGNGGWFGVGLFESRQKHLFLPFAESDFILAVIGEEIGLVGVFFVFSLFVLLILRGIRACVRCQNRYLSILGGGICALIAIQTLINIAVVSGCIPPTGIPLPFISYGGTSLVVFMAQAGILLNISRRSKMPPEI